jgi:hypothetical protein
MRQRVDMLRSCIALGGLVLVLAVVVSAGALVSPSRASFPGVNGKILFTARSFDGSGSSASVYSIDPDGQNLTRLAGSDDELQVAAAPGGARIAIERDTHEQCGHIYNAQGYDLYTATADGTAPIRLTDNCPAGDFNPAWSPSGTHIAWSRGGHIWSMRADGTDASALTCFGPGSDPDYDPSWSPDGRQILFERIADVWIMNSDGSDARFLVHGAGASFSPDGTHILYQRGEPLPEPGIHSMKADGTDDVRLTSGNFDGAVWSPDGTRIVFASSTPTDTPVYTMSADGSDIRPLTRGLHLLSLDWAAAGSASPGANEPNVRAADTACPETPPVSQPTAPPVGPPAAIPPALSRTATITAAGIVPPDHLVLAGVRFLPAELRSPRSFQIVMRVTNAARRPVSGAVVWAIPMTRSIGPAPRVATRSGGVAVLHVMMPRGRRLHLGQRIVLAVHARSANPGAAATAAVRLVSIRVGTS